MAESSGAAACSVFFVLRAYLQLFFCNIGIWPCVVCSGQQTKLRITHAIRLSTNLKGDDEYDSIDSLLDWVGSTEPPSTKTMCAFVVSLNSWQPEWD